MRLKFAVSRKRGVFSQLRAVIGEEIGILGTCAARIFPLRLCGQAVFLTCEGREPATILGGCVPCHADRGALSASPTQIRRAVWRSGARNRIRVFCGSRLASPEIVLFVLVPGDFRFLHPERAERHGMRGSFILLASRLGFLTPHCERASRNRNHFKSDGSARDRLGVI